MENELELFKFKVGDRVEMYEVISAVVVCRFQMLGGYVRYVIETDDGGLHICSTDELRHKL